MKDTFQNFEAIEKQRPRMLKFLKKMIQTPSPSGEERAMAELVSREMEVLGYEVETDGLGSIIGRLQNGEGKTILFDGHLDHVQAGDPSGWLHGPYSADVVNDAIYGRASVDMKGSLAAMLYGCASANIQGKVILTCVVHEETNEGVATRRIIKRHGLKPEGCVLGEPTNLKLSIGQRGRCVFKVSTRGSTSHASMPELGVNALYKMTPIIEGIKEANKTLPSDPFLGSGTMVVTTINCKPGVGPIVPDYCEILVDRRMVPQETFENVLNDIRELSEDAIVEIFMDEVTCYTGETLKTRQFFPGWITDPEHWIVREGRKALKNGLGEEPELIGWKFSTDGVVTAGELEIPTIGFGPGEPSLAHQPNEHISITDVDKAARCFCALAESLTALK